MSRKSLLLVQYCSQLNPTNYKNHLLTTWPPMSSLLQAHHVLHQFIYTFPQLHLHPCCRLMETTYLCRNIHGNGARSHSHRRWTPLLEKAEGPKVSYPRLKMNTMLLKSLRGLVRSKITSESFGLPQQEHLGQTPLQIYHSRGPVPSRGWPCRMERYSDQGKRKRAFFSSILTLTRRG